MPGGARQPDGEPEGAAPRYQRYVGPELSAVLAEVQKAHGSQAAIVSVDRVREGGVAGFFAKETFEVLVDGGAAARPAAGAEPALEPDRGPSAGPPAALSFADLLARRIEEEERQELLDEMGARYHPPVAPDPDDWFDPEPFEDDLVSPAVTGDVVEHEVEDLDDMLSGDITDDAPGQRIEGPSPAARLPRLGSLDWWTPGQRLLPPPASMEAPRRQQPLPSGSALEFWAGYDRACREAELLDLPPVALNAIVGPLPAAVPVVERCRSGHWAGACDVYALSARPEAAGADWTVVTDGWELAAIVADRQAEFPLVVIDVPPLLPGWVRPLLDELRQAGLGRIHYVLDGDPTDEDLATWHGEIGRPAVLDLVGAPPPHRVLELVDRGEPIASIAGVAMSADLLFALRIEVTSAR
ncbi:MAG: hypothetical protein OEY41_08070 [Acidimicrobiia bacterium]|nr:hypothetical protein [Acidimicrobiia bacterium]